MLAALIFFTPADNWGGFDVEVCSGRVWDVIWPGASMGCCSVIGACAFLAAASQGPISALVLVLELTRHVDATMAPMLLAVTQHAYAGRSGNRDRIDLLRQDSFEGLAITGRGAGPRRHPFDMLPDFQGFHVGFSRDRDTLELLHELLASTFQSAAVLSIKRCIAAGERSIAISLENVQQGPHANLKRPRQRILSLPVKPLRR